MSFTVTGGSLGSAGTTVSTDALGLACVDNLLLSDVLGNYAVTESVPAGYVAAQATTQTVAVTVGGTCANKFAPVAFHNLPLTNLTVSVDSQIPGGTISTITCGASSLNDPEYRRWLADGLESDRRNLRLHGRDQALRSGARVRALIIARTRRTPPGCKTATWRSKWSASPKPPHSRRRA